jgi:hypothetical protein
MQVSGIFFHGPRLPMFLTKETILHKCFKGFKKFLSLRLDFLLESASYDLPSSLVSLENFKTDILQDSAKEM